MKKLLLLLMMAAVFMQCTNSSKPNSKFGGVQIGNITYSFRSMPDQTIEGMLNYTLQAGINSIELISGPAEKYAGMPQGRDEIRQWKKTVSMDKFKEIRKMFNSKGVTIHMVNIGVSAGASDEEIDYAFKVGKTLGAIGLAMEVSEDVAKRISPFADKHEMYVIFHNHGQSEDPNFSYDRILAYGPRLMLNLDVGHYYSATGLNPCDLIKRLNKRIVSLHLKDKTWEGSYAASKNRPFGEGTTPLIEILQLIQKEKWPIVCHIEQEYDIPANSDAVKEVIKCVDYCRKALIKN